MPCTPKVQPPLRRSARLRTSPATSPLNSESRSSAKHRCGFESSGSNSSLTSLDSSPEPELRVSEKRRHLSAGHSNQRVNYVEPPSSPSPLPPESVSGSVSNSDTENDEDEDFFESAVYFPAKKMKRGRRVMALESEPDKPQHTRRSSKTKQLPSSKDTPERAKNSVRIQNFRSTAKAMALASKYLSCKQSIRTARLMPISPTLVRPTTSRKIPVQSLMSQVHFEMPWGYWSCIECPRMYWKQEEVLRHVANKCMLLEGEEKDGLWEENWEGWHSGGGGAVIAV